MTVGGGRVLAPGEGTLLGLMVFNARAHAVMVDPASDLGPALSRGLFHSCAVYDPASRTAVIWGGQRVI